MKAQRLVSSTRCLRYKSTDATRNAADAIIDKFVAPLEYSPPKEVKKKRKSTRASDNVRTLYMNLKGDITQYLPVENTTDMSPFEFHSLHNADGSYVSSPRLLVTKMLVNQWCQLRDFYRIFASSPRVPPTRQMQLGSEEHLRLEVETHPPIAVETPALLLEEMPYLYTANENESDAAETIAESILFRLYSLFVTSEAREIRVHGFVDLQALTLQPYKVNNHSVLINGVIDLIQLKDNDNPETDFSMIEELGSFVPSHNVPIVETYNESETVPIAVPSEEFSLHTFVEEIRKITPAYAGSIDTTICDVKTRSIQTIPAQKSVVEAAKFQVFYYLEFLRILANSGSAYQSLLDNWKSRNVDLDAPVNYQTLFLMLKKYGAVIYNDMERLAKGIPLGIEDFDLHCIQNQHHHYNPQDCFPDQHTSHPLLRPWKTPLTVRYFIARSAQLYESLGPFLSSKCKVEYRNVRTHRVIATKQYEYNSNAFKTQLDDACRFWSGRSGPHINTDVSRCKNCEFRAHCVVPHEETGKHISPSDTDTETETDTELETQTTTSQPPKIGDIIVRQLLHAKL